MKTSRVLLIILAQFGIQFLSGADFVKGDRVELLKNVPLYFKDTVFREGKAGELFTVILYQPETHRVYLSAMDASGKEIGLSVADGDLQMPRNSVDSAISGPPDSMRGRTASGRAVAMKENKMKPETEVAVWRGLKWLQDHQCPDGSWGEKYKSAMTGFALLCLLGHGETNTSEQYGLTVSKAIQWVIENGAKSQGRLSMENTFTQNGVYQHGILTFALGEYFAMTKDKQCAALLKQAVNYIIEGQGPAGGWAYGFSKQENDLSVSGWQIQALMAAKLSRLDIPHLYAALDKAMVYLKSVKGPRGGYGYRSVEDRYSLSGVGVLCRLYFQGNRGDDVRQGMQWILKQTLEKDKNRPLQYNSEETNLYAWYYHTQAAMIFGGNAWDVWNKWFQNEIAEAQNTDGSWPALGGGLSYFKEDGMDGQILRTSMCILMLEAYYRYLPSNTIK